VVTIFSLPGRGGVARLILSAFVASSFRSSSCSSGVTYTALMTSSTKSRRSDSSSSLGRSHGERPFCRCRLHCWRLRPVCRRAVTSSSISPAGSRWTSVLHLLGQQNVKSRAGFDGSQAVGLLTSRGINFTGKRSRARRGDPSFSIQQYVPQEVAPLQSTPDKSL
jgi:hypothetical protein